MKIKKTATAAPATTGGATIADRFKLDTVAATATPKGPVTGKTATTIALIAGLIAFALIGTLTYVLYMHWDYLMPA